MGKTSKDIIRFVLDEFKTDLSIFEESHIDKTITGWMNKLHIESSKELTSQLHDNPVLFVEFYESFKNGYSTFFRDSFLFTQFKELLIDEYVRKGKTTTFRIWDIGCSNGQESYSLAIAIEEVNREFNLKIEYQIFATDVSLNRLEVAKKGTYSEYGVEKVRLGCINRYFNKEENQYTIKDFIKRKIDFSHHDIVEETKTYPKESIYGEFDLIMISNVLLYYNESIISDIVTILPTHLSQEGYIMTSNSEIDYFDNNRQFERRKVYSPIVRINRKGRLYEKD